MPHQRARKIVVSLLAIVGLLFFGFAGFGVLASMRPQPKRRAAHVVGYPVETIVLEPVTFREALTGFGSVRAIRSSRLASRVSGRVEALREGLRPGLAVAAGEELFRLDPRPFEAEVASRRGVLQQAEAELQRLAVGEAAWKEKVALAARDLELARADYERGADLLDRAVISQREYDQKEMAAKTSERSFVDASQQFAELQAQIERARGVKAQNEAALRQAELDLEYASIKAPFDGIVGAVNVEAGEVVNQGVGGGVALVEVVAVDRVEVPVQLPASRAPEIEVGEAVRLSLPGKRAIRWEGKIERIAPTIDERNRTIEIYVVVNNGADQLPDLLPGNFVAAEVEGRRFENVLALPRRAFIDERVFVVRQEVIEGAEGEEGTPVPVAREVRPKVAAVANGLSIIEAGLQAGDEVLVSNLDVVYDGVPVRTTRVAQDVGSLASAD